MIINGRKRKDEIVAFKSKRTKRKHFKSIICCCYFHSIYILKFYCDLMNVYITLNKKDFKTIVLLLFISLNDFFFIIRAISVKNPIIITVLLIFSRENQQTRPCNYSRPCRYL